MHPEHSLSSGTHARLLEAGLLCFADGGYAATGIREITARAGINPSLVAYHFGGKAGLYREVLRYILCRKGARLSGLAGQLPPGVALPRREAMDRFEEYVRVFLESILPASPSSPLDDASMAILCREMEAPTPPFASLVEEFIRPMAVYLERLLEALRPDLDEPGRFAMGLSIQGQMVHMRNALGVIRLLRGDPAWPRDMGALVRHFTHFSLRGLGFVGALEEPAPGFLPIS
jgi:AcrR family transcriptional regulator